MKIMTVPQLQDWQARGERFVLVDVRDEDEFQRGHIPGSVNVPSGDHHFDEAIGKLAGGRALPVVVYCTDHESPASTQAGLRLEQDGFSQIYHLGAGLDGWAEAGLKVEKTPALQGARR